MSATGRRRILGWGHPVQLDRIRVTEHQVEHPAPVHVKPVVGQLPAADLIAHQPHPMRSRLNPSVTDAVCGALGQSLYRRMYPDRLMIAWLRASDRSYTGP